MKPSGTQPSFQQLLSRVLDILVSACLRWGYAHSMLFSFQSLLRWLLRRSTQVSYLGTTVHSPARCQNPRAQIQRSTSSSFGRIQKVTLPFAPSFQGAPQPDLSLPVASHWAPVRPRAAPLPHRPSHPGDAPCPGTSTNPAATRAAAPGSARSRPGCGWGGERRGEAGGGAERSFLRRFLPPPCPPAAARRSVSAGRGRAAQRGGRRGHAGPLLRSREGTRSLGRGRRVGPGRADPIRSAPPWRRPGPRPAEPRPGGHRAGAGWGRWEGALPRRGPGAPLCCRRCPRQLCPVLLPPGWWPSAARVRSPATSCWWRPPAVGVERVNPAET